MPITPATQEAEIRKIKVSGKPGKSWAWWYRPVNPATQEV
jgi:hypothetical protein